MPAKSKALMIQGTSSHVGKSVLAAALCRIFTEDGYRVAPFKAQNMSNNAAVTADGGEISRAQANQAAACRLPPTVAMNPILLKPVTETSAQLIVMGRPVGTLRAGDYGTVKPRFLPTVLQALSRVMADADLVVIEGAGSPAEVNLRACDLVNMEMARAAQAPVLLVGDIDRGGVLAHLLGTLEALEPEERAWIRGFLINKFRGDRLLLAPGLQWLAQRCGRPVLGVVPWLCDLAIPEEDSVPVEPRRASPCAGALRIEVIRHPRLANFTDFEALAREPDVQVVYVAGPSPGAPPDAVILPGSQSTIADLAVLRGRGVAEHLARCLAAGGEVVGICGGFQMLGRAIRDPERVEAEVTEAEGLGLLDTVTVFHRQKVTAPVRAEHLASGLPVSGYEIHRGRMPPTPPSAAVLRVVERGGAPVAETEGCSASDGRVWGTHLHGLFDNAGFRTWWLTRLRRRRGLPDPGALPDVSQGPDPYARLAAAVRPHLNLPAIYELVHG